jgi:2-dehydropantoate 2-reductase
VAGKRYSVIGSGALGGFYGCRLQRAGAAVQFLARGDYEVLVSRGWQVNSKDGDFELRSVAAYPRIDALPPADVVLLCLKSTSNAEVLPNLSRTLADDGVVLVMENGWGIEEEVAKYVGPNRVMGACCFLCSNKVAPGVIEHLDYGTVVLGDFSANGTASGVSSRMEEIGGDFVSAGIETQLTPDLRLARWKKLAWNIPFNGLSVILQEETNHLVGDESLRPLVRTIMDEVARAAAADDRTIDDAFLSTMINQTQKMKPYRTSMRVDYDAGRPLEVEAIFGAPLRFARERKIPMPVVESMYRELTFLDRRRRSSPTHHSSGNRLDGERDLGATV